MPRIDSLRKSGPSVGGGTWGRFSVVVDDAEVQAILDAIHYSTQPYSLQDWMEDDLSPLFGDSIVERFGDDGGGGLTGGWAPLQESTIRIKQAMGVNDPDGINTRTNQMLQALATDHKVTAIPGGAQMQIPGSMDANLREKLLTAQRGRTQGPNDLIPGAVTPPRPVIVITEAEAVMTMISLEAHIMKTVAMMVGAT